MPEPTKPHKRRQRYSGKNPRRFADKYKELDPDLDPETIAKVIASGKTPAGQHRPILVDEILAFLDPQPGQRGADVTLGYGGHTQAILEKLAPTGQLLALDVDSQQLPKTGARLRKLGYTEEILTVRQSNYAGLSKTLTTIGWHDGLDFLLADFGLSSMQIDNPDRGFSYKHDGPLDMRMTPDRGAPASDWIANTNQKKLARTLAEGGDEPHAKPIAAAIKQSTDPITTTRQLRHIIQSALPAELDDDARATTVARVFQAVRIAVNGEFTAIDAFLTQLPNCLRPGARVAVLTFHSGEDRRVKHHFREAHRAGLYSAITQKIIRPTPAEIASNPRAAPAKLRHATRSPE